MRRLCKTYGLSGACQALVCIALAVWALRLGWEVTRTSKRLSLVAVHLGAAKESTRVTFEVAALPAEITAVPVKEAISEEALAKLLFSAQPYFDPDLLGGKTPVTVLTHALRLWGPRAVFPSRVFGDKTLPGLGSSFMLNSLFRHSDFLRNCATSAPALLVRSQYGIQAISNRDSVHEGNELQGHVGQLLKTAGDIGLPASYEVVPFDASQASISDIVRDTAARTTLTGELEWITAGLSRYATDGTKQWHNRFGQLCSFDSLAERLCRQPAGSGACGGAHVPYGLIVLLRIDDAKHLLSKHARREAIDYFKRLQGCLESAQTADGAWDYDWANGMPGAIHPIVPGEYRTSIVQRIVITGHHLEWMALAPPELRPSDNCLRMAALYVSSHWKEFMEHHLRHDWHLFNPATHAVRGMWLLSGIPATDREYDRLMQFVDSHRRPNQ